MCQDAGTERPDERVDQPELGEELDDISGGVLGELPIRRRIVEPDSGGAHGHR